MLSISVSEAVYVKDFIIKITFNDGESGEVDLKEIIHKYDVATPLRNPNEFSQFFLDSWPTLAWKCGFDIAPETLYFMATGKNCVTNDDMRGNARKIS